MKCSGHLSYVGVMEDFHFFTCWLECNTCRSYCSNTHHSTVLYNLPIASTFHPYWKRYNHTDTALLLVRCGPTLQNLCRQNIVSLCSLCIGALAWSQTKNLGLGNPGVDSPPRAMVVPVGLEPTLYRLSTCPLCQLEYGTIVLEFN